MFDLPQMLKERAGLLRRVEALDRLIAAAKDYQASATFPPVAPAPAGPSKTFATPRAPTVMAQTESVVTGLLEDRKEPVPLADIVKQLRKAEVPLPEKNTNNVVSARLSNSKRFVGRRGIGWWFSDRPWPGEMEILRGMANENEAPDGNADGASEAGEVAASPIVSRAGETLHG